MVAAVQARGDDDVDEKLGVTLCLKVALTEYADGLGLTNEGQQLSRRSRLGLKPLGLGDKFSLSLKMLDTASKLRVISLDVHCVPCPVIDSGGDPQTKYSWPGTTRVHIFNKASPRAGTLWLSFFYRLCTYFTHLATKYLLSFYHVLGTI